MSFTYPLGLLGLLGIPVLIILYIIKSHYVEQTVASVYLWELSERFLKKRKRLNFSGLFSLIVQILAVIAISLTIAKPSFVLRNAANDYCFILDASGSMTAECGEKSRFEVGKDRIREMISESKDGSSYSLIVVGSSTFEAFRDVNDRESALSMLETVECGWSASECADALSIAQEHYTSEHSPLTYLITDKDYTTENIVLVNVANSYENYALKDCTYLRNGSVINVSGQVVSYDRNATVTVECYLDGEQVDERAVSVSADAAGEFSFSVRAENFHSIRLFITATDTVASDNEVILYSTGETENNKTLIVSDYPEYLVFALKATGKTSVDTVTTLKYSKNMDSYTGYGLYIFDTCSDPERLPDELPKDASVWLFDPKKSIQGTGFSYRETIVAEGYISGDAEDPDAIENRFEPSYTTSSASFVKTLLQGMQCQQIALKKYSRYVPSRSFTNIMTQGNDSLIFVGSNENGDRQVVFSFDLQDTNMVLKSDFIILINNLLSYSFPEVIEETEYTVGDEAVINVPAGCTDLLIKAPDGKITYPDFLSSYSYFQIDQVGTYQITVCVNGENREYYVYSSLPKEESYDLKAGELALTKLSDSTASDGYYNKLVIYFIILAIAFITDWGVYCNEQYYLR